MNQTEFIAQLEEVMEMPPGVLKPDTVLEKTEKWDSLAVVATIAMVDERLGVTLSAQKLTAAVTVADVIALVDLS